MAVATRVSPRSRARVLAVSGLYQLDLLGEDLGKVVDDVRKGVSDNEDSLYYLTKNERDSALDFFEALLRGTWEKKAEIDERLRLNLENWSLERLGHVERAILRLGCYELLYCDDIPKNVSLNEMVELSKSFCDFKSKDLINGVLDSIAP
jgi:transcription antitermination protein NusB